MAAMPYSSQLTLAMAIPTAMVGGAGFSVVGGAIWLSGQASSAGANDLAGMLTIGSKVVFVLTALCVACCLGFMVWIRRSAARELGGDPAVARTILAAVAEGNLATTVPDAPDGSLMHSVRRLVDAMGNALGSIQDAAKNLATATQEIAQGNTDLAHRTELSASGLQRTAHSMSDLTDTVRKNADNAHTAAQLTSGASDAAGKAGRVVADVVSTMNAISASSTRIADITGVIDGIAFQTNILALNAAVEAARAGEQGRGFAVVASEVRSLAQRSAQAAKEIKGLIQQSVEQVGAGSKLVEDAGQTMQSLIDQVQRVDTLVGEITAASADQTHGIEEVGQAIAELDDATQQNAALVEQASAAAESIKQQSKRLQQVTAAFQLRHA
jgi:methyl-accepting chemotaxis protein